MNVPLADLHAQYLSIKSEIDAAIQGVIGSSQFILGKSVASFESAFAQAHEARHCIAVGSGTDALHIALWAMELRPGDRVLTTPFTFIATVEAILLAGGQPVFADIDEQSFALSPAAAEVALHRAPAKIVLPVHLYGQAAHATAIADLSRAHGATMIEDAAQAHLAREHGRPVGSFGEAACFSFYPGKNLGAFGEAGAVITNSDALAAKLRLLRDHGQAAKYSHTIWGHNYRMDGLQGAVLGAKLPHLVRWTGRRREIAAHYRRRLGNIPGLLLPAELPSCYHVYHLFVVRTTRRDELQQYLAARNISTGVAYPVPLHLQPAFRSLGYAAGDFPVSEKIGRECLSLPIYAEMTGEQVEYVCDAVTGYFRGC